MTDWADHQAIIDVTLDYAWALDSRNWAGLDQVFTPDASADLLGRDAAGREAIVSRISKSLSRFVATQHIISNHQIRVIGDTANCRCYLQAQHVYHESAGGHSWTIGGRYEDELVRTAEGWRISHRTLTAMWTAGDPNPTGGN